MSRRARPDWLPYAVTLGLLLLLAALAYLPLILQLGFYKDDWHVIWAGSSFGPGRIIDEFMIDRPFMGRLYAKVFILLGSAPLNWHLFAFAARFASVVGFYALLRLLWPARRLEAAAAAALFILYPGFLQQPNANTFQNHFIGYALAIFSIALTVFALTAARRTWLQAAALALGAVLAGGYLLIYEYMIGLEAVRLLLIIYVLRRQGCGWRKWLPKTALIYLPYLLAAGAFLYWRLFIFHSTRPATDAGALWALYTGQPLAMLGQLSIETLKDLVETTFLAWGVPLYQLAVNAPAGQMAAGLLAAAAGVGLWWFFAARQERPAETPVKDDFGRAAIVLGALMVLVSLLPVLASNRNVYFRDQFDRYTLQATLGVALLLTGLIFGAARIRAARGWVAVLIAIALLTHTLNAIYWGQFWQVQRSFWHQLAWRAPQLEDETLLMAYLPPNYRLAEDYEIFSPTNLIYHPGEPRLAIEAEVLNADTAALLTAGVTGSLRSSRTFEFERDFTRALIVSWADPQACVHLLDPAQPDLLAAAAADPLLQLTAPYSHPRQVVVDAPEPVVYPVVFGSEPAHGWCYYYQKASLARQQANWAEAARLGDTARQQGLAPADPLEWLPMLQGYLHENRTTEAAELAAFIRQSAAGPALCAQYRAGLDPLAAPLLCP